MEETPRVTEAMPVKLPSLADRLCLFRRMERVVELQCTEYATLLDPRSLSRLSNIFSSKRMPSVTKIGIRKRQIDYLRLEFLPAVSAGLLLELSDLEAVSGQEERSMEEPVNCIALLVSNMVLVSQGNYDSRVRSILKTVCVELLQETMEGNTISSSKVALARSLYLLSRTKKEKEVVWELLSVQHPSLSPRQQAVCCFESIEKAVATDIMAVMVQRNNNNNNYNETPQQQDARSRNTWKHAAWRGLQITTVGLSSVPFFSCRAGWWRRDWWRPLRRLVCTGVSCLQH